MNPTYQSYCGIQCNKCKYREQMNCKGCLAMKGFPFWAKTESPCQVAKCCLDKNLKHCGECSEFPCKLLNSFAYDKEQGDNGERIENLKYHCCHPEFISGSYHTSTDPV